MVQDLAQSLDGHVSSRDRHRLETLMANVGKARQVRLRARQQERQGASLELDSKAGVGARLKLGLGPSIESLGMPS